MKLLGLKNIRKIFGFTMRDLAVKLDVSANAINIWENGGGDVPEERLEQLEYFFEVDKELLIKEVHDAKDLMLIELARSRFKINEYQQMIQHDGESINAIIDKVKEQIEGNYWQNLESQSNFESLKTLLEDIIKLYSRVYFDDYDECDSFLREVISAIAEEPEKWEYFRMLWWSLTPSEEMEDECDEDNIIYCSKEDILQKNIRDNVKQLYKLYQYKVGSYIPNEE